MRNRFVKEHNIDFLFLLTAFLLYTFCSVAVLLLAVSSYKGIVNRSEENSGSRAAMAYVRETIHQNDVKNSVGLSEFDGIRAIKICGDGDYIQYIYYYDGALRELYTKEDSMLDVSVGNPVMELEEYTMEYLTDSTIQVDCVDSKGKREKMIVAIRSEN